MSNSIARLSALVLSGALLSCVLLLGAPQQDGNVPDRALLSAWLEGKEVQQIPWNVSVRKAYPRMDLRYELTIDVTVRTEELQKSGDAHDLILFARVLDRGKAITPIYWKKPAELGMALRNPSRPPLYVPMSMIALVQPGKYKLELGLMDRSTGRYSTGFEDISVEGKDEDPLRRAFQALPRFEFAEPVKVKPRDESTGLPMTIGGVILGGGLPMNFPTILLGPMGRFPHLGAPSRGLSAESPSFVVDRPGTTHLSVISVLSAPDHAIGDLPSDQLFQTNLTNLLSVFTRMQVARGTADFTGVDLTDRKRAFDRRDMKEITPELLEQAIKKDTNTVSVVALAGKAESGLFFRDVLRERFEVAEKDTSGANHAIIVVGARSAFSNGSNLAPLPQAPNCRCQVFYVRFTVARHGDDDVERLLKAYKPRIFAPLDWTEFREAFGKIYEQIHR
jgi:hypothetical protein